MHTGPVDDDQAPPPTSPLLGAIRRGDPRSVSTLLSHLTPDERREELTGELAAGADADDLWSPRMMTPIFHAAYSGNVEVFSAVHCAMKAALAEDTVSRVQIFGWLRRKVV